MRDRMSYCRTRLYLQGGVSSVIKGLCRAGRCLSGATFSAIASLYEIFEHRVSVRCYQAATTIEAIGSG